MADIVLPGPSDPPTLADQLRGALYEASNYHRVTKITHEHRVGYLVPAHIWEPIALQRELEAAKTSQI